jgi:hypothetical protein
MSRQRWALPSRSSDHSCSTLACAVRGPRNKDLRRVLQRTASRRHTTKNHGSLHAACPGSGPARRRRRTCRERPKEKERDQGARPSACASRLMALRFTVASSSVCGPAPTNGGASGWAEGANLLLPHRQGAGHPSRKEQICWALTGKEPGLGRQPSQPPARAPASPGRR